MTRLALLIAGVTASGKSALAIKHAKQSGALIINCDSMQVYNVLNILTSRPQAEDLAQAKHLLYGFVSPKVRFSTGEWLREVKKIITLEQYKKRDLIFVGGTGLYFKALSEGFVQVPPISDDLVKEIEREIAGFNREERLKFLQREDKKMAKRLKVPDRQRVVRAISVIRATGKSLADWQEEKQRGLLERFEVKKILLNPEKEILNKRIKLRFEKMLQTGAVEEVRALNNMNLDNNLPAMKAIGVKEITQWLNGEISKEKAIEKAVIATRQYAKRQRTWFRKWQ